MSENIIVRVEEERIVATIGDGVINNIGGATAVDVVQDGNQNPVTSNAVFDTQAIQNTAIAGKQAALGFTPENVANRVTVINGTASHTTYGSSLAAKNYTDTAIANLVASSPSTLDTLNELAQALGNDPSFATTVTNSLASKVTKTGDTLSGVFTNGTAKTQLKFTGSSSGNDAQGNPTSNTSPRLDLYTAQISNYNSSDTTDLGGYSEMIRLGALAPKAKPTIAWYGTDNKPKAWVVAHFEPQDLQYYANLGSFPATGVDDGLRAYKALDTGLYYTWNGSSYSPLVTTNGQYYFRAIHQHISIETADTTGASNFTRLAIPYGLDITPITTSGAHFRITTGTKAGTTKEFGAFLLDKGNTYSYNPFTFYPSSSNADTVETWKDSATDNVFTNNTKGLVVDKLLAANTNNLTNGNTNEDVMTLGGTAAVNYLQLRTSAMLDLGKNFGVGIKPAYALDVRKAQGFTSGENILGRFSVDTTSFLNIGYLANGTAMTSYLIRAANNQNLTLGVSTTNEALSILGAAGSSNGFIGINQNTPTTRLHVKSGTANDSGLRLENLTSASPTGTGATLGVDSTGKVITVPSGSGGGSGVTDGDKGDVVISGTGTVYTVDANVIDNSKLAQAPTATIKGNATGATANVTDLTGTQVTALLNPFTSTLKGLVPASGGGTTTYLRADGTWVAPAGGGSATPGGSDTYVQFNDGGSFNGVAGLAFNKTTNVLTSTISYSTGHARVGSGTTPTNTSTGDLTVGRVAIGDGNSLGNLNGNALGAFYTDTTTSGSNAGIAVYPTLAPSAISNAEQRGFYIQNLLKSTTNTTFTSSAGVIGGYFENRVLSSGLVTQLVGTRIRTFVASSLSTATVSATNATGIDSIIWARPSGASTATLTSGVAYSANNIASDAGLTVTNLTGFQMGNPGANTITNLIGLDIGAFTRANTSQIGVRIAAPTNTSGATTNYALQLSDTGAGANGGITFATDSQIWRNTTNSLITNARIVTSASTTTRAGLNIAVGVAPTSPVDGDLWATTADAFVRINGVTKSITSGTGGSGTVTTVSVASANGFTGSVANASTTPAITLTTSVTGLVKGDGTALSAAAAGTDYLAPFASQAANVFYASPTSSTGTPTFRALVNADFGANIVPLASVAQIPGSTFLANSNAGNGNIMTLTPNQAKDLLNLGVNDVGLGNVQNALQVINNGSFKSLASGLLSARPASSGPTTNNFYLATDTGLFYRDNGTTWDTISPAFTGDVTKPLGSTVTTLATGAVTYAKIQNVTTQTLLGRYAATTGVAQEITIGTGLALNSTTGVLSSTVTASSTFQDGSFILQNTADNTKQVKFAVTSPASTTRTITLPNFDTAIAPYRDNGSGGASFGSAGNSTFTAANVILIGSGAGAALTNGGNNIAIGSGALNASQTSGFNIAIGVNALNKQTGGGQANTAIGYNALPNLVSGGENFALGAGALINTNNASYNMALGNNAGANTTGSNNVFIGGSAGNNHTTGSSNIFIGYNANNNGQGNTTFSNTMVVGSDTGLINTVYIGRGQTSATAQGVTIQNTNRSGTDAGAGNLTISSASGTGAGSASNIIFTTPVVGTTGTTTQTQGEIARMTGTAFSESAGHISKLRIVTASGTDTIALTDSIIGVNKTTAGTSTESLPSTAGTGQIFRIKDLKGDAATNNITVSVSGGVKTIDGAASKVLNTNYAVVTVMYDGTNYFIL